jgi:hypothetical protein
MHIVASSSSGTGATSQINYHYEALEGSYYVYITALFRSTFKISAVLT